MTGMMCVPGGKAGTAEGDGDPGEDEDGVLLADVGLLAGANGAAAPDGRAPRSIDSAAA